MRPITFFKKGPFKEDGLCIFKFSYGCDSKSSHVGHFGVCNRSIGLQHAEAKRKNILFKAFHKVQFGTFGNVAHHNQKWHQQQFNASTFRIASKNDINSKRVKLFLRNVTNFTWTLCWKQTAGLKGSGRVTGHKPSACIFKQPRVNRWSQWFGLSRRRQSQGEPVEGSEVWQLHAWRPNLGLERSQPPRPPITAASGDGAPSEVNTHNTWRLCFSLRELWPWNSGWQVASLRDLRVSAP